MIVVYSLYKLIYTLTVINSRTKGVLFLSNAANSNTLLVNDLFIWHRERGDTRIELEVHFIRKFMIKHIS